MSSASGVHAVVRIVLISLQLWGFDQSSPLPFPNPLKEISLLSARAACASFYPVLLRRVASQDEYLIVVFWAKPISSLGPVSDQSYLPVPLHRAVLMYNRNCTSLSVLMYRNRGQTRCSLPLRTGHSVLMTHKLKYNRAQANIFKCAWQCTFPPSIVPFVDLNGFKCVYVTVWQC